jgi:hypothetical protein
MYPFGNGYRKKYSGLAAVADRFRIARRQVKQIFVDETLFQINGCCCDYWLWIAYEPNLDVCMSDDASLERKDDFLRMLSVVLQTIKK